MQKTKVIEVNNAAFGYLKGHAAVSGVSFSVMEGSITMLIGPNGSGKTTLLKGMVGLLQPQQGTVFIHGKKPKDVRHSIGYVPQRMDFDHSFPITVMEFLQSSYGGSWQEIEDVLESLDSGHLMQSLIGTLSGGQLQRILIARSLLGKPKILFLDEPVSGIDVGGEENFYELMKEIQRRHRVTIVMVSHEIHLVSQIADQVVCVNQKMLCNGAPAEILSSEVIDSLYGHKVSSYTHSC